MHRAVLVALVAGGVYANSLDGALLYDDVEAVVRNPWVHAGAPLRILTEPSWWGDDPVAWRPLTTMTFAANYALHGLDPRGYHLINVLLHVAVSVLLYGIVGRLTRAPGTALIAALLFATHPIHTEAVASVVGRAELVAATGFFLAWRVLLAVDAAADRRALGARLGTLAALLIFAGAVLGKESAVMLLPLLVVADLLHPLAGRTPAETVRLHVPRYAGLGVVAGLFVLARRSILGDGHVPGLVDNLLVTLAPAERLMTAVAVVGRYAWRLVFPLRLSADYSYRQIPPVTSPLDPGFLVGTAIVLLVPVAVWGLRRRAPAASLGLALMAITFGLTSNLVFPITTLMAERLLYVPSAGFCLAVATLLARPLGRGRTGVGLVAVVVAVVCGLYGARTWQRNGVWRDPLTFFAAMARDAPDSARSHAAYGVILAEAGRPEEGRRALERSLAIYPDNPEAHYDLGNTLLQLGRLGEAVAAYERALARRPDYAQAMVNLGNAEARRGQRASALAWLDRAAALAPASPVVHANLANVFAGMGDVARADAEFRAALAGGPDVASTLRDYGALLVGQGRHAEAARLLERAVAADPRDATAWYNLGTALVPLARLAEAEDAFARAVAVRPDFVEAMANRGNVASLRGEHREALRWLRRAAALRPDSAALQGNVANELFRLGELDAAAAAYETALRLAPEAADIRGHYQQLQNARGRGTAPGEHAGTP